MRHYYTFYSVILLIVCTACSSPKLEHLPTKELPASSPTVQEPTTYLHVSPHTMSSGCPQKTLFLPIVMYHYVEDVQDKNDKGRIALSVSPKVLAGELEALAAAEYVTYYVRDIPDMFTGKLMPQERPIVLTFDDGYEDFYTNVFPLLKRWNMKATLYIISQKIGQPDYLTEMQLREIIASGLVEIGGHTVDHKNLAYASLHVAKKEIVEGKRDLEQRFHIQIESFAYPYGGFVPEQTETLVKEAGFIVAVSVDKGSVQPQERLFTLYRLRAGMFMPTTIVSLLEQMRKREGV